MKKTVLLLLCILFLFSSCKNNTKNQTAFLKKEKSNSFMDGRIIVYFMNEKDFCSFVKTPEKLKGEIFNRATFSIGDEGVIESEYISSSGEVKKTTSQEGIFRIGSVPVYCSLIDFWSDKKIVEEFLNSKGVSQDAKQVAFFVYNGTECVWITTTEDDYFVTIDEYTEDIENNIKSDKYTYRLYAHDKFIDHLRESFYIDNGSL